jgi:hypothetical protein
MSFHHLDLLPPEKEDAEIKKYGLSLHFSPNFAPLSLQFQPS